MNAGIIRKSIVAAGVGAALLVAQAAGAATGTTAPHGSSAMCGQGRVTVSTSMQTAQSVAAVPTTASGQYVARRVVLFRRGADGAAQLVASTAWQWGYASAGGTVETWHDYATGQSVGATFTVAEGSQVAVAVQYYWYATSDVGSGYDYIWAQAQDMRGPTSGYCTA